MNGSRGSVLVVDDEEGYRIIFKDFLESADFSAEATATGAEALALLNERRFDVVLLDGYLNGISGIETLRRIRRRHPEQAVVIVSAMNAVLEPEALSLGAASCTDKPTDPQALSRLIEAAMGRPS